MQVFCELYIIINRVMCLIIYDLVLSKWDLKFVTYEMCTNINLDIQAYSYSSYTGNRNKRWKIILNII